MSLGTKYLRTGYYDQGDALNKANLSITDLQEELKVFNGGLGRSELLLAYTVPEFVNTKVTLLQVPVRMQKAAEGGDAASTAGTTVTMDLVDDDYDIELDITRKYFQTASDQEIGVRLDAGIAGGDDLLNRIFMVAVLTRPASSDNSDVTGFYYNQKDVPDYKAIAHRGSAHDHYLVTASSSAWAAADLWVGAEEIQHHGFAKKGVVFYGSNNTIHSISQLSGFNADAIQLEQERTGYVGTLQGVNLVVRDWIPDRYGIFLPAEQTPVVKFKQSLKEAFRGLRFEEGDDKISPFIDAKFQFYDVGMNITMKAAGCVMYRGASWTDQTTITID